MATCSICDRPDAASIINELLEKKTGLDTIAEQTGFHRSSIHRHSKKCYPAWRASKLKTKRGSASDSGRDIARWPDGTHTWYGESIPASAIRETDSLFIIEYALPFMEHQHALALREDAERKAKLDGIPTGQSSNQSPTA